MNWLKENWFKAGLLAVLIIFIAGAFYWYEFRPNQIKQKCAEIAIESAEELIKTKAELSSQYRDIAEKGLYLKDDYKAYYESCLNKQGL